MLFEEGLDSCYKKETASLYIFKYSSSLRKVTPASLIAFHSSLRRKEGKAHIQIANTDLSHPHFSKV